jgi:hypothetical protein
MTTPEASDPIARRAREVFEAASADLDGATAGRLRLARRSALSASPAPLLGWLAPLAGAVAVGLAAWLAWPRAQAPTVAPAPIATTPVAPVSPPPLEVDAPHAPTAQPLVEAPVDEAIDEDMPADDETELASLDDEDAELVAWLADAPVAPDTGGDAL